MGMIFGSTLSNKLTRNNTNIIIGGMEYVSVEEAAEMTGYAPAYIRQLLRQKKIRAEKKGTMWWVNVESLQTYKQEMDSLGTDKYFQWREDKE